MIGKPNAVSGKRVVASKYLVDLSNMTIKIAQDKCIDFFLVIMIVILAKTA